MPSVCTTLPNNIACSLYLSQNLYNTSFSVLNTLAFQITTGYNKLLFSQPVQVSKGCLINLIQSTGMVAIDQSGSSLISDLAMGTNTYVNLNSTSNWRFFLNTTDNFQLNYYQTSVTFTHTYAYPGAYVHLVTVKNVTFQQIVNVTNCK